MVPPTHALIKLGSAQRKVMPEQPSGL